MLCFLLLMFHLIPVSQLDDKQRKRMFHQLIQLRYKVSIRAPPAHLGKEGLLNDGAKRNRLQYL